MCPPHSKILECSLWKHGDAVCSMSAAHSHHYMATRCTPTSTVPTSSQDPTHELWYAHTSRLLGLMRHWHARLSIATTTFHIHDHTVQSLTIFLTLPPGDVLSKSTPFELSLFNVVQSEWGWFPFNRALLSISLNVYYFHFFVALFGLITCRNSLSVPRKDHFYRQYVAGGLVHVHASSSHDWSTHQSQTHPVPWRAPSCPLESSRCAAEWPAPPANHCDQNHNDIIYVRCIPDRLRRLRVPWNTLRRDRSLHAQSALSCVSRCAQKYSHS